jgi:hypothetical protein
MNRRSFLAAVAAIPFVGKLVGDLRPVTPAEMVGATKVPPPVPNCAACDDSGKFRLTGEGQPLVWRPCPYCPGLTGDQLDSLVQDIESEMAQLLMRRNEILEDAVWVEAPAGPHRVTIRTSLPKMGRQLINRRKD